MKRILLFLVAVFTIFVVKGQVTAGIPDPIILCDVNNPGDEIEVFDMTIREAQIINGQSNVVVTYHPTSGDALSGINAYADPTAHTNEANPQIVFVRLQSTAGQGWDVTTLDLIVPLIPFVDQQPDDIFINEGDGDGSAIFDLTVNESQALGPQDQFNFQFKYYITSEDATNDTNAIADPETYQNTANPQTIYARMAPLQDQCDFETYDFEIETDGVLGVTETNFSDLQVYPNPVSEKIQIQSQFLKGETRIRLYNVSGKQLFSETKQPLNKSITIDLSSLTSGMYFVSIISEGNSVTKKLIKK